MPKNKPLASARTDHSEEIKVLKDITHSASAAANGSAVAGRSEAAAAVACDDVFVTPPRKGKNPFLRLHKAAKAGSVLVEENEDDTATITQHTPAGLALYRQIQLSTPSPGKSKADILRTPNGNHKALNLKASTPNGTEMVYSRQYTIETQTGTNKPKVLTKYVYSPPRIKSSLQELHKNLTELLSLSGDDDDDVSENLKFDLNARTALTDTSSSSSSNATPDTGSEFSSNGSDEVHGAKKRKFKGGEEVVLHLFKRHRKSDIKQNQAMYKTAHEAILNAIEENKEEYDAATISLMRGLAEQPFEWLHCLAYSLCPKHFKPQVPENLGAGPAWINSYMMILEEVAMVFAKLHEGVVSIEPKFVMMPNSTEVIDKISYKVNIFKGNERYSISNEITVLALKTAGSWPSDTDSPQNIYTLKCLMRKKSPTTVKTLDFSALRVRSIE